MGFAENYRGRRGNVHCVGSHDMIGHPWTCHSYGEQQDNIDTLINSHHYYSLSLWDNQSLPIMGSVVLPHLVTGWHVDQAIVCSRLQTSPLHPKTDLGYRCQKRTASLSSASDVTGTQTACVRMKFSTVRSPQFRNPPQGSLPPILFASQYAYVLKTNPSPHFFL